MFFVLFLNSYLYTVAYNEDTDMVAKHLTMCLGSLTTISASSTTTLDTNTNTSIDIGEIRGWKWELKEAPIPLFDVMC